MVHHVFETHFAGGGVGLKAEPQRAEMGDGTCGLLAKTAQNIPRGEGRRGTSRGRVIKGHVQEQ